MSSFVISLLVYASCNKEFLEKRPDEDLSIDDVFAEVSYAESFLTSVYSNLPEEMNFNNNWGNNPFIGASDEMEMPYTDVFSRFMNNGSWSADNTMREIWERSARGIRKANIFLENIDRTPMTSRVGGEQLKARWKGEALFLRGFFHFLLARVYGPIPIMDRSYQTDEDFTKIRRAPLEQVVDFIVAQCDTAAGLLTMTVGENDLGRATTAAALALKARVLLYMASPLWNGNPDYVGFTDKEGTLLFPQTYDATRWETAMRAAKDCIDQLEMAGYGLYYAPSGDPVDNYQRLFIENHNKEIIFVRNMGNFGQIEQVSAPNGMGGWSGNAPTQELVDAYQMSNGESPILGYRDDLTPITNPLSGYQESGYTDVGHPKGYHPSNIHMRYVGREPRFYASINYNEAVWRGRRIEFMRLGRDGIKGGPDYTPTGYLMKKHLDPQVDVPQGRYSLKTWIFFRLGEQYLNYAEALNEAVGPVDDVYTYVNAIRARAGLPGLKEGLTRDEMRERIRHERRIELAFETHRYFDCHRWKIAHITDAGKITGMDINQGEFNRDDRFYRRTLIETRVFESPKHYLWPIPLYDILRNQNLVQNPGWE